MSTAGYIAEAFVNVRPKVDPRFGQELKREVKGGVQQAESFGKASTAAITAPIIGLGLVAGREAINFESAFAGVIKTVDGTEKQLDTLRTGIVNMANEIPASREEIAGVAEAAGQLGVGVSDIEAFTRVMIDLGNATNLSSDEAATSIARIANVMQMPVDDVDNFGAALVDLGNNSATTEADIVGFANRLSGIAAQADLSAGSMLGIAAAASSVGIQAEAGGTSLTKTFKDLDKWQRDIVASGGDVEKMGGETAAVFDVLGLTVGELKDMTAEQMFTQFIKELQKADEEGGNLTAMFEEMGITEIRQSDALLKLVGSGDLLWDSMARGNEAFEENAALQKEVANRYGTTESKMLVMKNQFTNILRILGEAFIPMLADLLDALLPVFETFAVMAEQFRQFPKPIRQLVAGFLAFAAAVGPIVFIGAKMVKAFTAIRGALVALRVAMLSNPFVLLAAGVALAGYLIYKNWDKIVGVLDEAWGWIKETAGEVADFFVEVWEDALGWLTDVWDDITDAFETAIDGVTGAIEAGWEWISGFTADIFNGIKDFIEEWWRALIIVFLGPIGVIINLVINFWDEIVETFEWALDLIGTVVGEAWEFIRSVTETVWGTIRAVIETVWGVITGVIETAIGVIQTAVEVGFAFIRTRVEEAMWLVQSVVQTGWDVIVGIFNTAKIAITDAIDLILAPIGGIEGALGLAAGAASQIWGGIVGTFQWARDQIVRLIGEIKSAASDALGPLGSVAGYASKGFGKAGDVASWLVGRAGGGSVLPNSDYLVGEEGPEILRMGSTGGTVIPNAASMRMLGSGGGTREEHFHFHWDGPVSVRSDSDITKLSRELARDAKRQFRARGKQTTE